MQKMYENKDFSIIIVDDIPKNVQILGKLLQNEDYKVDFALDGKNALKLLQRKTFDLILLDIMMPDLNGIETCKRIRAMKEYDNVPILFLTAKTDKESVLEGFDVGAQDYITKPFDTREILARIRTQLENKQHKDFQKRINKILEDKVNERTIELRMANENLEKLNKELIDLDREKVEFLGIISHEIRTPLNGISGFVSLLKAQLQDERFLQYLKLIDDSSYRLEKFALQALLITDLRTKVRKIIKTNIKFNDIIKAVELKQKNDLESKKIDVVIEIGTENLLINADKELFTLCLEHLVENAINYSKENSKITVKGFEDGSKKVIEVIDSGSGFSKNALKNLFKLFSVGENHIDKNVGIDLALVNLIMNEHEGKIDVENLKEGGAKVSLTFPV